MISVHFIDTSVLCNLIPIPGRNQDEEAVREELVRLVDSKARMVLPITSVIESGNFIAQLSDGGERRKAATTLGSLLGMICAGQAPWVLHDVAWDADFLALFLKGGGTGTTWVDHATARLGGGDLCILTERNTYRTRTGIQDVKIWTLDKLLSSHA